MNNNITTKHNIVKRSTTTSPNEKNLEILRGRDGWDGLPGPRGIVGHLGPKGDTGVPGPKEDGADGIYRIVYVCWGHNSCPDDGAQLVMQVELEDHIIVIKEVVQ